MSSADQTSGLGLVGDVGATNARFRLASPTREWVSDLLILPTANYSSGEQLLSDVYTRLQSPILKSCVIVAAGPASADGTAISMINAKLGFDQATAQAQLGVIPKFHNDFFAQALSIPHLQDLLLIGGDASCSGVRAILGAGSGLGMATLVPTGSHQWTVLSSEGGHGDLAPGSFLEVELYSALAQEHPHVSWETVLSGSGMVNLYQAMSSIWGVQPSLETPELIVEQGLAGDPLCHQTLESFAGFLGGAAGNLALTVGARGGIYISGGIAPKLAELLPSSPLRRRFDERGALSAYVREIPLYLVKDEHPGMLGAMHSLD